MRRRSRQELDWVSPTPKGGWRIKKGLPLNLDEHFRNQETILDKPPQDGDIDRPSRRMDITSPQLFEDYCAEWARWLGFPDAETTQFSQDGGVDIRGNGMIAQVKFQELPVGVRPIRELNGVRRAGQEALFFSYSGFSASALKEARAMDMRLFQVSPFRGEIDEL